MAETVTFALNKIVRGGVLQDMLELGQEPEYRELEGEERLQQGIKKVQEEAGELDPESDSLDDELKDLQAALDALVAMRGYRKADFEKQVAERNRERGGFERAYFVGKLTLRVDDEWVAYYRKEPERFPEVQS